MSARALALAALLLPGLAAADPFHYVNMLVGDRAAGMGGAYTAVADDPTGLYYNPAGIVYVTGSSVSGSMNALYASNTTYRDALGARLDWKRTSSALLPNFFGVVQPFAGGRAGFSYAVLDAAQENQDQSFRSVSASVDRYTINFNNQDITYNAGPSYARALGQRLAVGLTLYGHMRTQERILNQEILFSSGDSEWQNQYLSVSEYGLRPILGLMWSPVDKLSLGLNLNRTFSLRSEQTLQETCYGAPGAGYPPGSLCQSGAVNRRETRSDQRPEHPWQLRTGLAWFPSPRLLLSGDLLYQRATRDRRAVLNAALGGEYYFSPRWALRAGVYTDLANTPELRAGVTDQLPHVDLYGAAMSLTRFARNSALTLGLGYAAGSGQAQLFAGDPARQDVDMNQLTVFLSAVYAY